MFMYLHTKAIREAILYRFAYGITEIKDIEELGTYAYTSENIYELTSIIKNGDYKKIEALEKTDDILGSDLTLFRFKDQNDKRFYSFYYTSFEFEQRPFVMEVFPEIL
jgi:hypothetical protein